LKEIKPLEIDTLKGFSKPLATVSEGLVMPFVARCFRCGYIVSALTRGALNIYKDQHESDSHSDYGTVWTTTIINENTFYQLERMMNLPAFWKTIRAKAKKRVIPLISV
jgi:hypothetical protein